MTQESSFRIEFRRRFPTIEFKWFLEIIELIGIENIEELVTELEREEHLARTEEALRQAQIREYLEKVIGETLHRELIIDVPSGIDLEHVQAILVYGFMMPTQRRTYVGVRYLPERHVRSNTERKLGLNFEVRAYQNAFHFLERNGVIKDYGKHVTPALYSLNLNDRARGVTEAGRKIIARVKQYLHVRKTSRAHPPAPMAGGCALLLANRPCEFNSKSDTDRAKATRASVF